MQTEAKTIDRLADFTTDRRVLMLSLLAVLIGAISAGVAWVLVQLIALITNLAFYQRLSLDFTSPSENRLGGCQDAAKRFWTVAR